MNKKNKILEIDQYLDFLKKKLLDGSLSFDVFKKTVEPLIGDDSLEMPQVTHYLEFITKVILPATKTEKGISTENPYPFDDVDEDFVNFDTQTISKNTKDVSVFIYRQVDDGTVADIFKSFGKGLNFIEFETHEQIRKFVTYYRHLLNPENHSESYTYFLFKNKKGKYFVAIIKYEYYSGYLNISVTEFDDREVIDSNFGHYFVVLARE